MSTNQAVLSVRGVEKHFGHGRILHDVNLEVRKGEVVGLLGPSGSGKTTLLRCLNALEQISSGEILFQGNLVQRCIAGGQCERARGLQLRRIRAQIAIVFQAFNLFPHLSAIDNVCLGPVHVLGMGRAEAYEHGRELLAKVGLSHRADYRPAQLSGGQQQRVAIARALGMRPDVILFDEVTSALDPEMTGEVLRVMNQVASQGMTMVVVTHEVAFAKHVTTRAVILVDGEVIEDDTPGVVLDHPRHERTRKFLNAVLPTGSVVEASGPHQPPQAQSKASTSSVEPFDASDDIGDPIQF